jgi:hypothetical protein
VDTRPFDGLCRDLDDRSDVTLSRPKKDRVSAAS